jgi:hypothetical protein
MNTSLKSLSFAWVALVVAMLVATPLPPEKLHPDRDPLRVASIDIKPV